MIFHLTEGIFHENLEIIDVVGNDDIFNEWFVRCETINKKENLYFVNRFSGLTLVARRLKFDFMRDMDLIAKTFRACLYNVLKRNGVSKEAIRKYIKDIFEYEYSVSSQLNLFGFDNICNYLSKKDHLYTDIFLEQDRLADTINKMEINFGNESHKPIWLHKRKLDELYEIVDINTRDAYEVSVKCDSKANFTRTFTLPVNINFFELHHIIDVSINSENSMIYEFVLPQPIQGEIGIKNIIQNLDTDSPIEFENAYQDEITLYDVFKKQGRLIYMTDLLGGTLFDITVKKVDVEIPLNSPKITELSGEIEDGKKSLPIDKINEAYKIVHYR